MNELLYKKLNPDLPSFRPAKPGDAGIDLYNAGPRVHVPLHQSVSIPTGVAVKIPEGYVGILTSRSSTFQKRGLFVVQGVIDSGYTGPLFTTVWNPGLDGQTEPIEVDCWQRLAQLIVIPYFGYLAGCERGIREVKSLPSTTRGTDGFGSTGE